MWSLTNQVTSPSLNLRRTGLTAVVSLGPCQLLLGTEHPLTHTTTTQKNRITQDKEHKRKYQGDGIQRSPNPLLYYAVEEKHISVKILPTTPNVVGRLHGAEAALISLLYTLVQPHL